MKKIKWTLIITSLLTIQQMHAQFRFGAKGGVNVSRAEFNTDVFRSDNITGFHIGPAMELKLGVSGWSIDLALLYSQKGFKSDEETVKNAYLEIPLNLKLKLGLPLVNPFVAAGPFIDLRIAGNNAWRVSDYIDQLEAKTFGAGLNFAFGVEVFDCIELGANYRLNLTDNYSGFDANDLDSYKGKSHTWVLSATIYF